MPFARITLRRGKPAAYRAALADGVYRALRSAFGVPEHNRFAVIHQLDDEDVQVDPAYGDMQRSDDLVMIQITANAGRSVEQKKALYQAIAENLAADPGVRGDDVHILLVEVPKENWSLGRGEAPYA
jgi:phenylpyruvate tautomerase PptA (4-oxalocrotonate tautomerase family)